VDLCTTLEAIRGEFKLCQALLGLRSQVRGGRSPDLSTVLTETVGSLFSQVELTAEQWQRVRGSEAVPAFGLRFDAEQEDPAIDVRPMIEKFRLGFVSLQEIWGHILPPATLLELKKMSRQADEKFRFPDEFWVRTIYDFALAHRLRILGRDHLMGALTPLYLAWVASFILSVRESRPREVAARIENVCKTYEAEKPYLISRWRWPDRFMP
jgi:glucosylglycerate synthase